jgi:hypothetical protein
MSVTEPAIVLHYRRRADSFLRAAGDLEVLDRVAHAPAIGLLSVHGCIALSDAVLVALQGPRVFEEDHREAARRLRKWCSAKRSEDAAVKHFEWLVGVKNHFSYDECAVKDEDCWAAKVKANQFFAWCLRTFPAVAQMDEARDA